MAFLLMSPEREINWENTKNKQVASGMAGKDPQTATYPSTHLQGSHKVKAKDHHLYDRDMSLTLSPSSTTKLKEH